ncbi:putative acyl-CoA dehydrogenase AidB [Hyphomicrobium sp. 1Nfss2.1]|uniref:isovaleryl-CoA dehydrogenase n=1 Tax=Hyphomicrobium sp. 1Nfss2.1 TaxID=3413936 RepID=UPI003C7E09CC
MVAPSETHEVFNQSPPFEDVNLYASDAALIEAVEREGGGHAAKSLDAFGKVAGSAEALERGRIANVESPKLATHDRQGRRRDVVTFHPAYHTLMRTSCNAGLHSSVWAHLGKRGVLRAPGAHVARAGAFYLAAQMEAGHCCTITMTNAAVPVLMQEPDVAAEWVPRVLPFEYDPAFVPAENKAAVTLGMGMTEKQGGTDVRAATTVAEPIAGAGPGREYLLTGHKWFLSAPMSDAFLVLAQAQGGLTCFLVPRFRPDGSVNALYLQRLKDKLGNRSNASSEVEFQGAWARAIGEEGRGVATIIEMVTYTRLDCAISSAGLMRFGLANAVHHAEHRTVFQKKLVDQPVMQQVLADMALDVEAATALSFRLARAFDRAEDPRASAWRRLMTPVTKYWVCKMAPPLVAEAMECLGGNGYVEEAPLARLYREVPVNSIWEGSGNVMALDVARVLQREPLAVATVMDELASAAGDDQHLRRAHARLEAMLQEPKLLDARGRTLVEALAVLGAATILRAHAPAAVADAFIATRISGDPRSTYGQGLEHADVRAILNRASPNAV